jgi:hypothetical protein
LNHSELRKLRILDKQGVSNASFVEAFMFELDFSKVVLVMKKVSTFLGEPTTG